MLTFSAENPADQLHYVGNVLACITDLIASRPDKISFTSEGAAGLCSILSAASRTALSLSDEMVDGFQAHGAGKADAQPQPADDLRERMAALLAEATPKGAPASPKLTEEAPPKRKGQARA